MSNKELEQIKLAEWQETEERKNQIIAEYNKNPKQFLLKQAMYLMARASDDSDIREAVELVLKIGNQKRLPKFKDVLSSEKKGL